MNFDPPSSPLKFLVIRRDNIGDLVCTTPLFTALRQHFPDARIDALVNSYTQAVLKNNTEITQVFWYSKAKHQADWMRKLSAYWQRALLMGRLRRMKFDYAILASPGFQPRLLRLARWIKPRHIIGYTENGNPRGSRIDIAIPHNVHHPIHEAEDVFRLLSPLGITGKPPAARVFPDPAEVCRARGLLINIAGKSKLTIGVHISARKPSQRWPAQRFAALMERLHEKHDDTAFMLFWSPGAEDNPLHPGDDAKAQEIIDATSGIPVLAYPTQNLGQLIAGLSLCDKVICSDGGAMHIAAGLGKPLLCFFGKSDSAHWYPWGVPYQLLQPPSHEVTDISVADALEGFEKL